MTASTTATVIGSGFGGLSLAIRLQGMGFQVTLLEKLDKPGGRAYVREQDGFYFDMGPTVITVPQFIEELFSIEIGDDSLETSDFPDDVEPVDYPNTKRYCDIRPISPFYRIYFDDGTFFDYDGDPEGTRRQIKELAPEDLEGYERFHDDAQKIFRRGFMELGYTYFGNIPSMLAVTPDLLKLDAIRNLFRFAKKYFKSDKMQRVFSFETLLVGGNPLKVPAIYSMIHFVEKTWGIHYVMGGTGALIRAYVKKFQELGGVVEYNAEVSEIMVEKAGWLSTPEAKGVKLSDGRIFESDVVCSNADYATTYMKMIPSAFRTWNPNWKIKMMKYSMSLLVIYFGFKKTDDELDLRHHNIILSEHYAELLTDIFDRKVLSGEFSQYLHVPTLTDPSMAPEGHHAAYTLIPVPHLGADIDWSVEGDKLCERVIRFLDEKGYIPNLRENIVSKSFVDPRYFEDVLGAYLGNGFGVEPTLTQTAFFRPHNRSEDIKNLYLVGANTQPGAGTPSVMMSAKMTARLVKEDWVAKLNPAVLETSPSPEQTAK